MTEIPRCPRCIRDKEQYLLGVFKTLFLRQLQPPKSDVRPKTLSFLGLGDLMFGTECHIADVGAVVCKGLERPTSSKRFAGRIHLYMYTIGWSGSLREALTEWERLKRK